jgi:hypothetical protein
VSALRKFLAIQWKERMLLMEAWLYLGAARAVLLVFPFRRIAPRLGRQLKPEQVVIADSPAPAAARQVGWAVDIMARHTPWASACLAQSIAGKLMLRRRRQSSVLYLGMKKDESGKLAAHAWLRSGRDILVGAAGQETFTVLGMFGEHEG